MSIEYYNSNADQFFDSTIHVDMSALYEKFTELVPSGSLILDLGCGTGRDSKYFFELGYDVEAIDGSYKLVEKARQFTGLDIKCADFFSIKDVNKFDAIWACASLLHVDKSYLPRLINQLVESLKDDGVMYCSFKYGNEQRKQDGRSFTDLNEISLFETIQEANNCYTLNVWLSEDNRPKRNEKWLNCFIKKAH